MTAGYDQYANIRRFDFDDDDLIGGANPTGTVVYAMVPVRMEPIEPTMALMEQGLEAPHFYKVMVGMKASNVKENDELEVVSPYGSWYFGYRFRVQGVRHPSTHPSDPRTYTLLTVRRLDEAHGKTISG